MARDLMDYDGVEVDNLKHIDGISFYNHNYYEGLVKFGEVKDLLFAESDDDNTTVWYLVTDRGYLQIGYSQTSDEVEKIIYYTDYLT